MTHRDVPGPHDPDADHLNTLLDAMRSGKRSPDAESTGDDAANLATTAARLRRLDDRAKAAGASDAMFDSIWEDMMSVPAYAGPAPEPFSGMPSGRTRDSSQRIHPVPPQAKISRLQSFLSAAIVAIMIAGLVSAAWNLRGGGGDDPGPSARLAATALDGTPEASPTAEAGWMAWITPEECTAEPMSREEYGAILAKVPDTADRSYTVVGPAEPQTAREVVTAARGYEACTDFRMEDQRRGAETDAHIFYRNPNMNMPMSQDEYSQQQMQKGNRISAQLQMLTADDFYVVTQNEPPEELKAKWGSNSAEEAILASSMVFNPASAVVLEDGRVLIPQTAMWWSSTSLFPESFATPSSNQYVGGWVTILKNVEGTWKVDESLSVCIGACEGFWGGSRQEAAQPSTPESTPAAEMNWWTWATADQCMPEKFPENDPTDADLESADHNWAEREYAPLTKPSQHDADAVAAVARQVEACSQRIMRFTPLESDWYYFARRNNVGAGTQDPNWMGDQTRASREVSEAYPITDPETFVRITTEEPVIATPSAFERQSGPSKQSQSGLSILPAGARYSTNVYIPDQAVQLTDGRIAIPGASLLAEGTPESDAKLDELEHGMYLTRMLVFTNQNGTWLLDEELMLCIGECRFYWESAEQMATRATDSRETPVSSPVAEFDWRAWVTPEECAVEPMTAEEYREIMRTEPAESVIASRSYTVAGTPEPAIAGVVAESAREHEACNISRMTDQKHALESPAYIYISNTGATSYQNADERIVLDARHGAELSAQLPVQDPAHYTR